MANFSFDDSGSSHQHRNDLYAKTLIQTGHLDTLSIEDNDRIVVILPCADHALDYYNNHFFKHEHGQLINYVLNQFSQAEAEQKLNTQWGYDGKFDATVPRWIMREWCSFWISDVLDTTFNLGEYNKIDATVQISTQDIFENWVESFDHLCLALSLTQTVDVNIIKKHHEEFLKVQKFHNAHLKCNQIVSNLLNDVDSKITLHSIFDEAYIQQLLRQHGFEIQCDGIDIFPSTTHQLKALVYKTTQL